MNILNLIAENILNNLVSILTFILTPICSAIVVYYQIRKSHIYWRKQQGFLIELEKEKLRILTYRETVELTNHLNDAILNHHIYASNRDISYALFEVLKTNFPDNSKHFYEEYLLQKVKAEESYLNMRNLTIKFSGLGVNIKMYFNQELFDLYTKLHREFKQAHSTIYSQIEIIERLKQNDQLLTNWASAHKNITEDYGKKIDHIRPVRLTDEFLTRFMKDFEKVNDG